MNVGEQEVLVCTKDVPMRKKDTLKLNMSFNQTTDIAPTGEGQQVTG